MEDLLARMCTLLECHSKELQELRQVNANQSPVTPPKPTLDVFASRLGTFTYDSSADFTFAQWFQRHELIF